MTSKRQMIMAWGQTFYARRDSDGRRPSGGQRIGRWHAIPESQRHYLEQDAVKHRRWSSIRLRAICGWVVEVDLQRLHEYPTPPVGAVVRGHCKRCLAKTGYTVAGPV